MPLNRRLEVARKILLGRKAMPPKEALSIAQHRHHCCQGVLADALAAHISACSAGSVGSDNQASNHQGYQTRNHRPSVSLVLRTLGIPRSTWYYHRRTGTKKQDKTKAKVKEQNNAKAKAKELIETAVAAPRPGVSGTGGPKPELSDSLLKASLEELIEQHPDYGYRRLTAALRQKGAVVNSKRVRRLLKEFGLAIRRRARPVKPNPLLEAVRTAGKRANLAGLLLQEARTAERNLRPFELLYTDFTLIAYAATYAGSVRGGSSRAWFLPILDHASRVVVGYVLAPAPTAAAALSAWQQAKVFIQTIMQNPTQAAMQAIMQDSTQTTTQAPMQTTMQTTMQEYSALQECSALESAELADGATCLDKPRSKEPSGPGRQLSLPFSVTIHHDQGGAFLSHLWVGNLLKEGHHLSYSLRGPRDNPIVESFFSRFKQENGDLFLEAASFIELKEVIRQRLVYYNELRLHSGLGYQTPMEALRQALKQAQLHATQQVQLQANRTSHFLNE